MYEVLRSLVRVAVGVFWLFFASQKWGGVDWMRPLMDQSAQRNPIPGIQQILAVVVVPNWHLFALAQAVGETLVGALLVLGIFTRGAAWLGVLLAAGLSLSVAFDVSDVGQRWLYYLAVIANLAVVVAGPGAIALGRARGMPRRAL